MEEILSINIESILNEIEVIDISNINHMDHIPYMAEIAFNEEKGIELYRFRINENNLKIIKPEKVLLMAFKHRSSPKFNYRTYFFFFREGKKVNWLIKANPLSSFGKNIDYLFDSEELAKQGFVNFINNYKLMLDNKFSFYKETYLSNINKLDEALNI